MTLGFDDALSMALHFGVVFGAILNSLSFSPITEEWTAYFSNEEGYTYLHIRPIQDDELLAEMRTNYVPNNWLKHHVRKVRAWLESRES
jgi:hypothetical protein